MPPSQHMRKVRERVLENVREHARERAYTDGIEEVSDREDIFFVDPDKLTSSDPEQLLKQLLKQVEGQLPGEFADNEVDIKNIMTDGEAAEAFILFANKMKDSGPAAVTGVGIVIMPSSDYETKEAFLRSTLEDIYDEDIVKNIIDNMPGNDKDWNRLIGNHEGTHIAEDNDYDSPLERLTEETRADVGAEAAAHNRGDGDIAFAFRDLRHLRADMDISHATGVSLTSGDPISQLHVDVAETFKDTMSDLVDTFFDWEEYEGKATTPEALLEENPEAYFNAIDKGIDEVTSQLENALATYDKPLTFDETTDIVRAQIEVDYIKNYEGAYRRRVMDQDIPEHKPTQFISQEAENAFYVEFAEKNKEPDPTPAELEQEKHEEVLGENNNIPKQAFENFDWEAYEGKATTTGELLFEDSGLYYQVQIEYMKEMQDKAQAQYDTDPSYENTQKLIEAETLINNRYESMDRYRSEILGENVILREALELIPEDKKDAYYEERANRNNHATPEAQPEITEPTTKVPEAETKGITESSATNTIEPEKAYEVGVNDSVYTTEVSGVTSGAPSVDFEEGVTVNGAPITNVFAEMANPDPNDIKLVDARTTTPEEQFTFPIQDAQNNANISMTA